MDKKNKTVLLITDNQYGPDIKLQHQTKALLKCGFNVLVFCLTHDKKLPGLEMNDNLYLYRYYINLNFCNKLKASVLRFPFYTNLIFTQVINVIQKLKVKINSVQVFDLPLTYVGKRLKDKFTIPLILDFREPYPFYLENAPHTKKFLGRFFYSPVLWRSYELEALSYADKILCVIEEAADRFPNVFRSKLQIIPNVVDVDEFDNICNADSLDNNFNIIHFGEITETKGCQNIIDSLIQIKEYIPNIRYYIVGDGAYRNVLQNRVLKLNLTKYVTFKGWVSYEEANFLIRQSHIGIISSLRCNHMDFTVPTKLYHYMMLEKPVIASDCPPVKRLVNESECGIVYSTNNEFNEAVLKIYNNPGLAKVLGINGKKNIMTFNNWDVVSSQYAKCFAN